MTARFIELARAVWEPPDEPSAPDVVRRSLLTRIGLGLLVASVALAGAPLSPRGPAGLDGSRVSVRGYGPPEGTVSLAAEEVHELEQAVPRPATPAPRPTAASGDRHALLIGIDRASGSRPLYGAVQDAVNMHAALLRYGFHEENITMLVDEAASAGAIGAALDDFAGRVPADGVAVFAFAGHTRIKGGSNALVAADGELISASALASELGRVRAPMWVALPTCYAGGYSLPGIVGHNRVATFASERNEVSYEIGDAGSYLVIYMVREQMLGRNVAPSVEQAFERGRDRLKRERPNRVPYMVDGYPGDLVLGRAAAPPDEWVEAAAAEDEPDEPEPQATPQPTFAPDDPEDPDSGGGTSRTTAVRVCGKYRYACD